MNKICDPNMVVVGEELPDCDWYSCSDVPLTLEGIRFRNSQNMLRRMPVCIQDNPDLRITSYNVCYTKLLRVQWKITINYYP